ncbi:DUF1289 domain-containing protein [Ostreibacterium oceani]|uniref:DUF1289 domain-containing protein n=1 Tax=Ostreibacterium oceani TaxID=2654998 RepID=A0A6N7EUC8_9GAMM|nr:DUF1289 domain-containing protein [Ostreibacterium oceani]MPV86384.1 DUF1289 domain-containing protein [Ostreibacterium oceani]
MKRNQSPCIDLCVFSGPKGWCLGCGRTREECQKWRGMKPYAKNSLLKELTARMRKIKEQQQDTPKG